MKGSFQILPIMFLAVAAESAAFAAAPCETAALQGEIDRLAAAGGGTLTVGAGVHRTGALFFRPGVNLHLEKGAVLLGSDAAADYPIRETRLGGRTFDYYPAMLNADRCDGFRITGEGVVDGHGLPAWRAYWAAAKAGTLKHDFGPTCHAAVTLGSECFLASNVVVRNCRFVRPYSVLTLKMRPDMEQVYSDVVVMNCTGFAQNGLTVFAWDQYFDLEGRKGPLRSVAAHVTVDCPQVTCPVPRRTIGPADTYSLSDVSALFADVEAVYDPAHPEICRGDPQPDCAVHPGRYRTLFGAVPTEGLFGTMDPQRLIRPVPTRILCTHAAEDDVVPIASARNFFDAWTAAGNKGEFYAYSEKDEPNLGGHRIWRKFDDPHRLLAHLETKILGFLKGECQ